MEQNLAVFLLSSCRPKVQRKKYASNVALLERRMFRMFLRGVLLGRMPVSSFRVRQAVAKLACNKYPRM